MQQKLLIPVRKAGSGADNKKTTDGNGFKYKACPSAVSIQHDGMHSRQVHKKKTAQPPRINLAQNAPAQEEPSGLSSALL